MEYYNWEWGSGLVCREWTDMSEALGLALSTHCLAEDETRRE